MSSRVDTTREYYDKEGRLTSVYYYSHGNSQTPQIRMSYAYNNKGFLTTDSSFGNNQPNFTTSYRYDLFSKKVFLKTLSVQGDTVTNSIVSFRKGKVKSRIELDKKGDTIYSYSKTGLVETTTYYKYNLKEGNSLRLYRKDIVVTDNKKHIITSIYCSPEGYEHDFPMMVQQFDKENRVVTQTVYRSNGSVYYFASDIYSSNGLLQRSTITNYTDKGELESLSTELYSYNNAGQLLEVKKNVTGNYVYGSLDQYFYNEKGLLKEIKSIPASENSVPGIVTCTDFVYTFY
ncbi:MAG TPA: hypothetical protein VFI33_16450 [Puia sp.]|nr:hypothetical protein [Puia sp.]